MPQLKRKSQTKKLPRLPARRTAWPFESLARPADRSGIDADDFACSIGSQTVNVAEPERLSGAPADVVSISEARELG